MRMSHLAFFLSLLLSRLADQMLLFLVPLVVFQTSQSAALSGLSFFIEALPRYLLFPLCGILCDQRSPIALLFISQRCRLIACLAGIVGHELIGGIGWLIALSAICGVMNTQGWMAREVMLPQIFRQHRFEKVLSYSQIGDQLGVVAGPMFAALFLGLWPWQVVVAVTALLFLAGDLLMIWWRRTSAVSLADPEPVQGSWLKPIGTAFVHIRRLPGLKSMIGLAVGVNLVIGVTLATSAPMVTGFHGQTEQGYALLQTAGAVATVLILMLIARTAIPLTALGLVSYGTIFLGGLVTGIASGYWLYVTGFLLVTGFDKMFNVYIRSMRQKLIPARDFGKTTGVVIMLNNLSQPLAGLLVSLFSSSPDLRILIAALSVAMGLIGLAAALVAPALVRTRA